MPHKTELVETLEENGHFIAEYHCCGCFGYRHSAHPEVMVDEQKLSEWLARGHKSAALAHEASIQAKEKFHSLKGSVQEHS